jgi:small GTP-binding protein
MEAKKPDISMKLLLLGDQAVGKSSLILRYADNEFNLNIMGTAGVDLKRKNVTINNENIKVNIYDTAGHERFRQIAKNQYKGSDGIIIIYDITDKKSFENVSLWMTHIKENSESGVEIMLIGNKIDRTNERQVKSEEGLALSQKYKINFMETSAKTGENVDSAFLNLIKLIYNRNSTSAKQENNNTTALNTKKKTNSKCC